MGSFLGVNMANLERESSGVALVLLPTYIWDDHRGRQGAWAWEY